MSISKIINLIIVIFTCIGLSGSYKHIKLKMHMYYTIISNFLAGVVSLLFLIFGQTELVLVLRYTATCMLLVTFIVTILVLLPITNDKEILLWHENFFNHIAVPVLSLISYMLFEDRNAIVVVPVIASMVYGTIALLLNVFNKLDGPYPFFQIYRQKPIVTVLWMIILPLAIYGLSLIVSIL